MAEDLLGSGDNQAQITTRDGESMLLPIPSSSIEWGRTLNGVSVATMTVNPARCSPRLADVEPWAHGVVIYRNDVRVWEGVLRRRVDSAGGLQLVARDVVGLTERRPVTTSRKVIGGLARAQMLWSVQQAFAADDPNILAHVQQPGTATETADLEVKVGEKYHSDVLSDMAGNGGRYTALGRSIILWDEAISIGQLRDLSPENHLLEDVDLVKDGDLLATKVWARNDDGVVGTGSPSGVTAVDPRYGLVGLIVASNARSVAGVARTAQSAARKGYPVPLTIDVPSTAALRCDAPFPIQSLVPGVLVPMVTTTATATTVRGMFMLTDVSVKQDAGKDEVVTITLAPPSEAVS